MYTGWMRGCISLSARTVLSLRWNEAWGETDAEPFQLGGTDSDPPTLLPILNQRDFALRGYSSGEPSLLGQPRAPRHRSNGASRSRTSIAMPWCRRSG